MSDGKACEVIAGHELKARPSKSSLPLSYETVLSVSTIQAASRSRLQDIDLSAHDTDGTRACGMKDAVWRAAEASWSDRKHRREPGKYHPIAQAYKVGLTFCNGEKGGSHDLFDV